MRHDAQRAGIVDQRVARDTRSRLIGPAETAVDDDQLAAALDRALSLPRLDGDVPVDDMAVRAFQADFPQDLVTDSRIDFKTDQCTSEILTLMEQCYLRLSEYLPYTPITAVGFNLDFHFTQEEFQQTTVGKLQRPRSIGEYNCNTVTYSSNKDNATRSFVIQQTAEGGEIRVNFHYSRPNRLPAVGTCFELIATEMRQFLGYEYSIK